MLVGNTARDHVHQGSIGDRVYEVLLSSMISLKIPPGSRLSIDALVRELGVSATPVRAALIRLEASGLVVKTHNVGYSAAPLPSRRCFEDMFELRLLLEPYLAGRAAERLNVEAHRELVALAATMTDLKGDDVKVSYGKFAVQDADFHSWIADHGENELAAEALRHLHGHIHLFRLLFHSRVTEDAILEHAKIVEALSVGSSAAAQSAMIDHIQASRSRVAPFFEELAA